MTNFEAWMNDADMPTKIDGLWVDLETGINYDPSHDYRSGGARSIHRSSYMPSLSTEKHREYARQFGGRALTGTAKQKEWAEKIRAEMLAGMNQDQAEMACDPKGLMKTAKAWIENRKRKPREIGEFVMEQKAMLRQFEAIKSLRDLCRDDERRKALQLELEQIAEKYNALTKCFGF